MGRLASLITPMLTLSSRAFASVATRADRPVLRRAIHDGLTLVGLGVLLVLIVWSPGSDAHAYWNFSPARPYTGLEGDLAVFL